MDFMLSQEGGARCLERRVGEVVAEVNRVRGAVQGREVQAHTALLTARELGLGREPVLGEEQLLQMTEQVQHLFR